MKSSRRRARPLILLDILHLNWNHPAKMLQNGQIRYVLTFFFFGKNRSTNAKKSFEISKQSCKVKCDRDYITLAAIHLTFSKMMLIFKLERRMLVFFEHRCDISERYGEELNFIFQKYLSFELLISRIFLSNHVHMIYLLNNFSNCNIVLADLF